MIHFEEWTIAYRKKQDDALLIDDKSRPFQIIKNTWRYWCADPHLFDYNGQTYVFAELYDRILRKGVIGYCEITDYGYTPWKVVLKMPWHLSYPHLFTWGSKIYMIPESYVGKEIAVYEAISFPDKWIKVKVLKKDYVAVDSTLFSFEDRQWLQTLQINNSHEYFNLFAFDGEKLSKNALQITVDDLNIRPGGKLFYYRDKFLRPTQDCTESYGCALNFYEVLQVAEDHYEERLFTKIKPNEIRSNFPGTAQGIHTYNQSHRYEIIDLKSYEFDWLSYIMRPIWFILRRIKHFIMR